MLRAAVLTLAAFTVVSCTTKKYTQLEYMPDMYRQLSLRPQEPDASAPAGVGMRQPPPGTVPRDYEPYMIGVTDTTLANAMSNPLQPTPEVLAAGRKYFNNYCIVCHGARGDGRGFIVPKFTMPPPLFSDKVVHWSDGRIYYVISNGQGLMNSYASQLLPEQRWAIIHYVRALQRAARPSPDDVAASRMSPYTLDDDLPDTARTQAWPAK
jgi:mono/diheme cytochrome c family protein